MSERGPGKRVDIEAPALSKNDRIARENRSLFRARGLFVVNLISSPGSGKTALLEAMANRMADAMAVIEGDVQTRRDAERVAAAGARAVQIETGGACHLNAEEVAGAFERLGIADSPVRILVIENVGNLVCPSAFDLGENMKAAILSTPEGDDKVLKYPSIFRRIGALVINKMDLLPRLEFDVERVVAECASLNQEFETFPLSARTGEGVEAFCRFLLDRQAAVGPGAGLERG